MPEKLVINTAEFADAMQISLPKAYEILHSNSGPPVIYMGRSIRIPVDGLKAWLVKQSERGRAAS